MPGSMLSLCLFVFEVCVVVFLRVGIALPKNVEVKHDNYFDWPDEFSIVNLICNIC